MSDRESHTTIRPTPAQIDAAAVTWCGEKERETFHDDVLYFRNNWRWFPGLHAYVVRECAKEQP